MLQFMFIGLFHGLHAEKIPNTAIYTIQDQRRILYNEMAKLSPRQKMIVNFTSIYCGPCRKKIPELLQIVRNNSAKVKVIFVVSESSKDLLETPQGKGFMRLFQNEGKRINQILFTDVMGTVKRRSRVKATPCTFVLNKDADILLRIKGYKASNHSKIIRAI